MLLNASAAKGGSWHPAGTPQGGKGGLEVFPSLQKNPGSSTERPHNLNTCVQGCNAAASVPRPTLLIS